MGVFLRFSCFPMVTINYERFQTLQYFSALAPVLKKLYPNKEDQISAAKRHMAFYNTTPEWMGFTLGMNCAQEEQIANMPYEMKMPLFKTIYRRIDEKYMRSTLKICAGKEKRGSDLETAEE